MKIIGSAYELEIRIGELLKDLLPEGTKLKFEEYESSRAVGFLMDDRNEYFGVLAVSVSQTGKQNKQLARINSKNVSSEGSGQYLVDRVNYEYVITEKRVLSWFPRE